MIPAETREWLATSLVAVAVTSEWVVVEILDSKYLDSQVVLRVAVDGGETSFHLSIDRSIFGLQSSRFLWSKPHPSTKH
jgi:hypothetical protein